MSLARALSAAFVLCLCAAACSNVRLGDQRDPMDGGQAPTQFSSFDSGAPEAEARGLCPTNECPAGRVTCPNNRYRCGVDLRTDDDNCGACGVHCPDAPALHMSTMCVDAQCRLWCEPSFDNCNGYAEDGCEANILTDEKNCGTCGFVCAGDEICSNGVCTCSIPGSCGLCGVICPPSPEPGLPFEWNAHYDCAGTKCNQPQCNFNWDDCNGDFPPPPGELTGDGCEHSVRSDPKNCGACGNVCAAGETCRNGQCRCECGAVCFHVENDIDNCGACNTRCPGDRRSIEPSTDPTPDAAHGKPICADGICDYRCTPGWGDCDGSTRNGCETLLTSDPLNCGGCGIRCDGIEGQACVDGHCTMKACDVR